MRAAMIEQHGEDLKVKEVPVPQPGPGQVLVRIQACGVCHTDVHACDGDWAAPTVLPLIPGHEGVGVVEAVGEGVTPDHVKVGDKVGIAWLHQACGSCEFCNTGRESLCTFQETSGYSVQGCFADYTIGAASHVAKIPDGLSAIEAAPILCAGVTTYAGIKATVARPGQWVTIIGAAGGLGHLAVQYAVAMGLRVVGLDVGADKLEFVKSLGAEVAIDALDKELVDKVVKATNGGAHGVLCLAANIHALKSAVQLCRRGGTVVMIGLPKGELGIDIVDLVMRGITLRGSIVGTRMDLDEALDFAGRGKVKAQIETTALTKVAEAFTTLKSGKVKGRLVLDMGQ